jgi:hypothetical protein
MGALIFMPLLGATCAKPESTLKVNGKVSGWLSDFFYDTLVIEFKAQGNDGSFTTGTGSIHGINCHATFFFNSLTITQSSNGLVFAGVVTGSNTPTNFFVATQTAITLETSLSGDSMTLTIVNDDADINAVFTGSGIVVP